MIGLIGQKILCNLWWIQYLQLFILFVKLFSQKIKLYLSQKPRRNLREELHNRLSRHLADRIQQMPQNPKDYWKTIPTLKGGIQGHYEYLNIMRFKKKMVFLLIPIKDLNNWRGINCFDSVSKIMSIIISSQIQKVLKKIRYFSLIQSFSRFRLSWRLFFINVKIT